VVKVCDVPLQRRQDLSLQVFHLIIIIAMIEPMSKRTLHRQATPNELTKA